MTQPGMHKDDGLYMAWALLLLALGTLDLARPGGAAVSIVAWSTGASWFVLMTVWFARRGLARVVAGRTVLEELADLGRLGAIAHRP